MADWIECSKQLPELDHDGRSELIQFEATEATTLVGYLVRELGDLWWVSLDGTLKIPQLRPEGLATTRWVTRWRPFQ